MKLVFQGKVSARDYYRTSQDDENGALWIGDHDVVTEVEEAKWSAPVTCTIISDFLLGNTTFAVALKVTEGWGHSEFTPMESDELFVGPHDLLGIIGELEGRDVTVWFSDEPVNILERAVLHCPN